MPEPDPLQSSPRSATRAGASTRDWHRIAIVLVTGTLAYNVVEAVIAVWAGVDAASVALVGFGFDSMIETAAASALLYRIALEKKGAAADRLERTEHRVHQFVGFTLLALALYVIAQSAWVFWFARAPEESTIGIVLAALSLVLMPLVSWGKLRAASEIGSAALRAEAKETLACSYLSFTLLLGLVANAYWGWWWADPAAALLMVPWLMREGLEGLRGESCCDESN